ncbi:MAG TPA: methyltetrahydrofolate--corrinoid methyltransferase [Firmicutes bacterium]|jgi:5-methyltetrahydrofolate--homocysteine methyltransferase|nr:methyltetrahydrofolate--corrinoid methyltransferase [Bacillota bacterium]
MIIIGERINTSRGLMEPAVRERNADFIKEEAKRQQEAGADYIDLNCGTLVEKEVESLVWLVQTVQEEAEIPICLDSPNPEAIAAALAVCKGKPLVNSITLEEKRFSALLPLLREYGVSVVALTMDDQGLPESTDHRLRLAEKLVTDLTEAGIGMEDIYLDPLVRPVSTDPQAALMLLETMKRFKENWAEAHIICGLSNISYGYPLRKYLNQAFLVMALQSGLDAAILDPLDHNLMGLLSAAQVLLARDEFGANYIQAYRNGKIGS